jgi:iron complex transport system ATP-binding protein
MLETIGLHVVRGGRQVLGPVDLRITAGELVAICGPNGAGKTTLLKVLSAELLPTRGEVRLDGKSLQASHPAELASRRAVVPQATSLSFPFTALEVVELGASVPGFARAREAALAAMERIGIRTMAHRQYLELSGGERQKVHFARALCQLGAAPAVAESTTLLLLDEPTANLDLPHQASLLKDARREAERGRCVIAVLHDLNLAAGWADRLMLMSAGRVVGDGRPVDVINDDLLSLAYASPIRANELPAKPMPFVLPQLVGA